MKVNDKDILQVRKFSKTQPRPVAENTTPMPSVRMELTDWERVVAESVSGVVVHISMVVMPVNVYRVLYRVYIKYIYIKNNIAIWHSISSKGKRDKDIIRLTTSLDQGLRRTSELDRS